MKLNESLVLEKGSSRSKLDQSQQSNGKSRLTSDSGLSKIKKVSVGSNPKMNKFLKDQVQKIKNKRREIYNKQQEDLNSLE